MNTWYKVKSTFSPGNEFLVKGEDGLQAGDRVYASSDGFIQKAPTGPVPFGVVAKKETVEDMNIYIEEELDEQF